MGANIITTPMCRIMWGRFALTTYDKISIGLLYHMG
nr:MAG TPA: hypothetical protein [Caudoviricetes sp.]